MGTSEHQFLRAQHGVNWIPDGYPGSGNLILYNNFHGDWMSLPVNDWQSAVYEIEMFKENETIYLKQRIVDMAPKVRFDKTCKILPVTQAFSIFWNHLWKKN